jgi:type II secretory pathway pseudopilin PulG
MPEAEFETGELKENLDSTVERHAEAHGERAAPPWLRPLSLTTALIAVMAAVASLLSGSFSNDALLEKNEAVLLQARASDQWAFFQAKGLKGALAASQAEVLAPTNPALSAHLKAEAERYKGEQTEIQKQAHELEAQETERNEASNRFLERHHQFALAVTLFQIAIALGAIAALARRQPLWWLGLGASVVGIAFSLRGLFL